MTPKTSGSNVSTAAQITQAWWLPSRLSPPNANSENQLCRNRIVTPAVTKKVTLASRYRRVTAPPESSPHSDPVCCSLPT